MGKNKKKQARQVARGTGILEAQASAEAAAATATSQGTDSNLSIPEATTLSNASNSAEPAPIPSQSTASAIPHSTSSTNTTSNPSTSVSTSSSSNNTGPQQTIESAAATRESSGERDVDTDSDREEQVRLGPPHNTVWGSGAASNLFRRDPNPAAVFSRPRNGPPEEEIRHINLDYGEGFSESLHEQTITITLTGPGWGQVRNEDIFIALLEKGLDPRDVVGYWKAAEHRYMNITLRSPEAARYVQDMESIRINDATGTIRGQQHILDVKLHWVPAWMDTYYLKHIMQQYGEVMKVEREQLVLHDDISFDSGTVMMRIKTTRQLEPRIPCVLKFHGPAQGSVLVSVRGRPQRCLSCWQFGHVRRFCERRREVRAEPARRMQPLGPVRQRNENTQQKTVATGQTTREADLISWEEAVRRVDEGMEELEIETEVIPPTQPPPERSNVSLLMEMMGPGTEAAAAEDVIPETQTTIPSSQPELFDNNTLPDPGNSQDTEDTQESSEALVATAPLSTAPEVHVGDSAPSTSSSSPSITPLTHTPTSTLEEDTVTFSQVSSRSRSPSPEVSQSTTLSSQGGRCSPPASPGVSYYTPPSQTLSTPSSSILQGVVSQTQLFSSQENDDGFQVVERRRSRGTHSMPAMVEAPRRAGVASRMRGVASRASGMAEAMMESIKRRTTPPSDQPPDKRRQP